MKKETRTAVYDEELRIEAFRFQGIVQPFPQLLCDWLCRERGTVSFLQKQGIYH